jgi:hypothetical protein
MTFKEATDLLCIPLERVAEITGRSYQTVLSYRNGVRQAPPDVMEKLSDLMADHGQTLLDRAPDARRASQP